MGMDSREKGLFKKKKNHLYWKEQRKLTLPDDSELESTALHTHQDISAMRMHRCIIPSASGLGKVCWDKLSTFAVLMSYALPYSITQDRLHYLPFSGGHLPAQDRWYNQFTTYY